MASNGNPWGGGGGSNQSGGNPKLSRKVSQKLDRTMEVASVGVAKTKAAAAVGYEKTKVAAKKVKEGTTAGVNWIKLKCNKSKLLQKK